MDELIKVLFVCMGNICRSPTAEGIFIKLVEEAELSSKIITDSAGTHGSHVGSPPDKRTQAAALKRGVDIHHLRARQVSLQDFVVYDYILAMDKANYYYLCAVAPESKQNKIALLLSYSEDLGIFEVPDPYSGGINGFDHVFDLCQSGAESFLKYIIKNHNLN
jgi:protein-tyrosine phosphatase